MLDEVGRRVEHAGDDELVVGQLHLAEHDPLVLVTRIGALEGERLRTGPERDGQDLAERDVAVMRALVVAPAQVQAKSIGRDVAERVIERFHVGRGDLQELRVAQVGKRQVAAHRQVGTIDLEHEARAMNCVVLVLHHVGQPRQVGLATWIVLVLQEVGDDAGRGGGHERLGRLRFFQREPEVLDVLLHRRPVLPVDGAVARRA